MCALARLPVFFLLACCLLQTACSTEPATPSSPPTEAQASDTTPLSCATASDCEVKNVGNCCGYYPACVHKDQAVDPDGVQARCAAEGRSGICGFPEISACACVEGRCTPAPGSGTGDPRTP